LLTALKSNEVVIAKKKNGDDFEMQQWELTPVPKEKSVFCLRNRGSELYLGVESGATNNAARIVTSKLNGKAGSADQQWRIERVK
jgi:hypothetical protein